MQTSLSQKRKVGKATCRRLSYLDVPKKEKHEELEGS